MPVRLIIAYTLIALMVAAIAVSIGYVRYNSRENVLRRERDRRDLRRGKGSR